MKPNIEFHIRDGVRGANLAIGPGKVALLEAIARTGSISSAAKDLNMSYRRAWLLVDETNRCLIQPAVDTAAGGKSGGGASLTRVGTELVSRYRALEHEAAVAVARRLKSLLRSVPARNGKSKDQ
jgi:molybdate transport system regulatory protein